MTDESNTDTVQPRRGGWPKGKPRGPRVEPQRASQRPAMGPRRTRTGRVAFDTDDVYAVDRSLISSDMDLQWVTRSVMGKDDDKVGTDWTKMMMNGWTPVDASVVPQYGRETGEVNIGGLVLCQRPREMSEEAREEDWDKATGQVSNQIARMDERVADIRKGDEAVSRRPREFSRGQPIPVRSDNEYTRG